MKNAGAQKASLKFILVVVLLLVLFFAGINFNRYNSSINRSKHNEQQQIRSHCVESKSPPGSTFSKVESSKSPVVVSTQTYSSHLPPTSSPDRSSGTSCKCCDQCRWCSKCVRLAIDKEILSDHQRREQEELESSLGDDRRNSFCYKGLCKSWRHRSFQLAELKDHHHQSQWCPAGSFDAEVPTKDCDCTRNEQLFSTQGCDPINYRHLLTQCMKRYSSIPSSSGNLRPPDNIILHGLLPSGLNIVCYSEGDLVCNQIKTTGRWEPNLQMLLEEALDELSYMKAKSIMMNNQGGGANNNNTAISRFAPIPNAIMQAARKEITFLDIGSNVGAFSLHFWRSGYQVLGVDAFPLNTQLLDMSICLNKFLENHQFRQEVDYASTYPLQGIEVYNAVLAPGSRGNGLGDGTHGAHSHHNAFCGLISHQTNVGDIIVHCGEEGQSEESMMDYLRRRNNKGDSSTNTEKTSTAVVSTRANVTGSVSEIPPANGYVWRGLVAIRQLDEILPSSPLLLRPNGAAIVKIDVEGSEAGVFASGKKFFSGELKSKSGQSQSYEQPRLILVEMWLSGEDRKRSVRRIFQELSVKNNYKLWVFERRAWIRSVEALDIHLSSTTVDADNFVFVLSGFERLLKRGYRGPSFPKVALKPN